MAKIEDVRGEEGHDDWDFWSEYLSARQLKELTKPQAESVVRGGYTVVPHAQAFCDYVEAQGWSSSFGTYAGHDPTPERATDVFVAIDDPDNGYAIADYAAANMEKYGIDYVIYRQRIYNPEIADYWRDMADRGSPTQNHMDHNHLSYREGIFAQPGQPGDDDLMSVTDDVAEIRRLVANQQNQMNNVYAYLFFDRKGEDRGGAGLDNAELQTNDAVNTIRAEVRELKRRFDEMNVVGVDQEKVINEIVKRLKKDLRGIV
jgi:hypothetical protein